MRDFGDDLDSICDRLEAILPSAKKPGGNLRATPDFFLMKVFSMSFCAQLFLEFFEGFGRLGTTFSMLFSKLLNAPPDFYNAGLMGL